MNRVINFSAGPSALPLEVLQQAKNEFMDYQGRGFGIMEISHRSSFFDEVYNEVVADVKQLYALDDEYEVLLIQGGASLGFAMVGLNYGHLGRALYADTGVWTQKAIKEAGILGLDYEVVASSKDSNYDYIPEFSFSDGAYGYICSNNTIYGTQYHALPASLAPLIIDASSDVLSKPIDFKGSNIGLLFAGAQKNAGIAGVCLNIIKKELLEKAAKNLPTMLSYETYAKNQSMFNTPPTFAIYMLGLVLKWIKKLGGLSAIKARNEQKAELLYSAIDESEGFYKGHAKAKSRSLMNVSFNIPASKDLELKFWQEAAERGMLGLKGHKHIGGIRASIYNAIELSEVQKLAQYMKEFASKNA